MVGLVKDTDIEVSPLEWATLSPTGLVLKEMDFSWDEYEKGVEFLLMMNTATQWAIGDAYHAGMMKFLDRDASQVFTARNVKWKTIQNYAWVCNAYTYNQRWYPPSFSHHSAVAKLTHTRRVYWLERTLAEDLSVDELEALTAFERGVEHIDPTPFDEIVTNYNLSLIAWRRLPEYPEKKMIERALTMINQAILAIQKRIMDGEKEIA